MRSKYFVLMFLVVACNSRVEKGTNPALSEGRYATIRATILNPLCVQCHSAAKPSGSIDLSSYSTIISSGTVSSGKPNDSSFYTSVASGRMPKGSAALSETQLKLIYDWITDGAGETDTQKSDPLPASFAVIQSTLLQKRCVVCHNTQKPRGKVDLSSYDNLMKSTGNITIPVVKGAPEKSTLFTTVNEGKMPPQPKYLDQDELTALSTWIKNGALEKTEGALPQPPQGAPNPPQPTYEWLSRNLFPRRCGSCHGLPYKVAGIDFTSYSTLMNSKGKEKAAVVAGAPEESGIYTEAAEKEMPPKASPVSDEIKESLRKWIEEGAQDN